MHAKTTRQRQMRQGRATAALAAMVYCMLPPGAQAQSCQPAAEADYDILFDATWSQQTHPDSFPSTAHFSGLLSVSHNAAFTMWAEGSLASAGIEQMAETGSRSTLINEVNAAIGAGSAHMRKSGPNIGTSPGMAATNISVTQSHPLVSLTTMIAPSPDWFTGLAGVNLFELGNWVDSLVISARPYDSGTDSGSTYSSSNSNTSPPELISEIVGAPFLNGTTVPALGTITLTRTSETCVDSDGDDIGDDQDNCTLVSNADQRDTDGDGFGNRCDPDLDGSGIVNFADLAALKAVFLGVDEDADFDGDGEINFGDLAILKSYWLAAPGPAAP